MKINVNAVKKITKIIESAQSERCTQRLITHADPICIARIIEDHLDALNVPKTARRGLKVSCDPNAQNFPGTYKYPAESTSFCMERGGRDWYVVSISRSFCARAGHKITWENFDLIADVVLKNAAKPFC